MSILSVCGIAFLCICAVIVVRENGYKTFAVTVSCVCSLAIILYSLRGAAGYIAKLRGILDTGIELRYADVVIRSFGIAFVCEICSDNIRELGGGSVASALELAAKAEILLLCASPLNDILTGALKLAGQAV